MHAFGITGRALVETQLKIVAIFNVREPTPGCHHHHHQHHQHDDDDDDDDVDDDDVAKTFQLMDN